MSEKHYTIYLKNRGHFETLIEDVKTLWYSQFGESHSASGLIVIAMEQLREQLSGKTAYDFKRQTIHKYGRIRISGE